MKQLQDHDKMPFGQYQGRIMEKVPADYLHWLWHNGIRDSQQPDRKQVADYISRNMKVLKLENKDLVWKS